MKENNGESRGNIYIEFNTSSTTILFKVLIEKISKELRENNESNKYFTKYAKISESPLFLVSTKFDDIELSKPGSKEKGSIRAYPKPGPNPEPKQLPQKFPVVPKPPIASPPSPTFIYQQQGYPSQRHLRTPQGTLSPDTYNCPYSNQYSKHNQYSPQGHYLPQGSHMGNNLRICRVNYFTT